MRDRSKEDAKAHCRHQETVLPDRSKEDAKPVDLADTRRVGCGTAAKKKRPSPSTLRTPGEWGARPLQKRRGQARRPCGHQESGVRDRCKKEEAKPVDLAQTPGEWGAGPLQKEEAKPVDLADTRRVGCGTAPRNTTCALVVDELSCREKKRGYASRAASESNLVQCRLTSQAWSSVPHLENHVSGRSNLASVSSHVCLGSAPLPHSEALCSTLDACQNILKTVKQLRTPTLKTADPPHE